MKNRITELFSSKKKNLLSVFYTAGFPAVDATAPIGIALAKAGADLIEIGIPFSDPVADGPTIQASNKVALANGMNVRLLLKQVVALRKENDSIPVILMGYLNPVIQYGMEAFLKDASAAGVDGLILPDMPLDEFQHSYRDMFARYNLCNTFLISPTTSEQRIRMIDGLTNGFIYAVSASSTTGAKGQFSKDQLAYFERLGKMGLRNPFLIGFGISDKATFSAASSYARGAIVGSAFINLLAGSGTNNESIAKFVGDLKG